MLPNALNTNQLYCYLITKPSIILQRSKHFFFLQGQWGIQQVCDNCRALVDKTNTDAS